MLISFGLPRPGSANFVLCGRIRTSMKGDFMGSTQTFDRTAAGFSQAAMYGLRLSIQLFARALFVNDLCTRVRYFQCILHLWHAPLAPRVLHFSAFHYNVGRDMSGSIFSSYERHKQYHLQYTCCVVHVLFSTLYVHSLHVQCTLSVQKYTHEHCSLLIPCVYTVCIPSAYIISTSVVDVHYFPKYKCTCTMTSSKIKGIPACTQPVDS